MKNNQTFSKNTRKYLGSEANTNTLKDLLSINKRVLSGLHYIKGFDFEKPFDVISGRGSFTMNSINKQCKEHGTDTVGTTAALLILKKQDYLDSKQLYIVDIKSFTRFDICKDNRGEYRFNLNKFYSVGDFESTRKRNTDKYYVVMQKKEYLTKTHKEKEVDYSERLESVGTYTRWRSQDNTRGGFSSGRFKQGNKVYDINECFKCTIDNPIDSSGYWLPFWKNGLDMRLSIYKANKRKHEADNYALTSNVVKEMEKLKEKVGTLKHTLSDMLLNDKYKVVYKVIYKYISLCDWLKHFEDKLMNKKYKSVSSIRCDVNYINQYYKEIMEVIDSE